MDYSAFGDLLYWHRCWDHTEKAKTVIRGWGTGEKSMKGVKKGGDSLLPRTGEPRSGIALCSRKDILIYKLRMFWSPTAEIDLVVHLIQLKSEFENNYDSRTDRQLQFCSPALQFLLSVFPPHPFFPLRLFLGEGSGGPGQMHNFGGVVYGLLQHRLS